MEQIDLSAMNPKQILFFKSAKRRICYGGARGGGKSWGLRTKFVLLALKYPYLKLLLLRRTLPELMGNHIIPLRKQLNGIASYVDSRKTFEFANGSVIKLGFCDTDGDVGQYQGQEYDVIGFEEATNFTEYQYQEISLCNRSPRDDFEARIYFTCNPGGVGHAWVKRLFIDKQYNEFEDPDDYEFISASVYDNTVLMQNDPNYVKSLEALPEARRRAMLYGDWDVYEGQYFTEFRKDVHVIEPFKIPDWWRRFASIDWGYNDPCCILFQAIDGDGRVYTYREYYQRETLASEVADIFLQMSKGEKIDYVAASPDMWQRRGAGSQKGDEVMGRTIADDFLDKHIPLVKADRERLLGWSRVREYMAQAPDGLPYWQCFNTCINLIRTIPLMLYDEVKVEDISARCEDHGVEALRYGLMSKPIKSKQKEEKAKRSSGYNPFGGDKKAVKRSMLSL